MQLTLHVQEPSKYSACEVRQKIAIEWKFHSQKYPSLLDADENENLTNRFSVNKHNRFLRPVYNYSCCHGNGTHVSLAIKNPKFLLLTCVLPVLVTKGSRASEKTRLRHKYQNCPSARFIGWNCCSPYFSGKNFVFCIIIKENIVCSRWPRKRSTYRYFDAYVRLIEELNNTQFIRG